MGKPITVFGDGSQRRSFTHVADAVQALTELAMEPEAVGRVFNIGNTEELSIGELARLVKRLTGSASPIVFVPYDQAYEEGFEDIERRVPSVAALHQLTGFKPQRDINDILRDVIAFWRQ
jgi:UDP-glucose 4-epimerase